MNEKVRQYQLRFFNKLFSILPAVKKLNTAKNELGLNEAISHIYYFHDKDFWFSKGENDEKYVFIFGLKNKAIHKITIDDALLIIDFDKNKQYNDNRLGMFSIKESEIHIVINKDILHKRYPYYSIGDLKTSKFQSIDRTLQLNVIDLGSINNDFIDNLRILLNNLNSNKSDANNVEKSKKQVNTENTCEICLKDINHVKIDANINNLKNIKPNLCGKCIENIVVAEFYDKVKPLLNNNDVKSLDIAKEKFGNDQLFDYGIKLLEKHDIIKYIGVKKLYYTIDTNPYIVSKFKKFSDENNLLIDHIFNVKSKKTKKSLVDGRKTNLTKKTIKKMNNFLNALQSGKSCEKALKSVKLDKITVKRWYNLGKKGQVDYVQFYNKFKSFKPQNNKRIESMNTFLNILKTENNLDTALEKSNLTFDKIRGWYNLGKKGEEEYINFYFACNLLIPDEISKPESKKIVNNEELMNEFITLIDDGKSNEEAIEMLKIPNFKVNNWIKQGKNGDEKYIDFYNAYQIQINRENEKEENKSSTEVIKNSEDNTGNNKTCEVCGRTIKKSNRKICKRCARKQYASKIIIKLLKSIEPGIPFKKEDLKILGLQNLQIQDYIWTLQEFNLIIKENNKFKLKNQSILDDFIKKSGISIEDLPMDNNKIKLSKTCKTCGENLQLSKFSKSSASDDGYDENCKECRKLITAAGFLKEITKFINPNSNFSEDELKPHFENQMQLQGMIWSLIDNDLVKRNFEENNYILTDEKTITEFLDKYYKEKPENQKIIKTPKEYTKQEQMEIIINEMSKGKSRKEAAKEANIALYKITHWYNEGKQGFGEDNINFYKKIKKINTTNEQKIIDIKIKMDLVLNELKNGKKLSRIIYSDELEIKEWLEKGKQNIKPYSSFYHEYNKIISSKENDKQEYYNKEINRKIFLENFKAGKTKEESAKNADIYIGILHEWYLKGKNSEEPYVEFYDNFNDAKNNVKPIPKIKKTNGFGSKITINQMNIILENITNGMSEKEAVENADISYNTYKYWLNRGKQNFGEIYTEFYKNIKKIKSGEIKVKKPKQRTESPLETFDENYKPNETIENGILNPLPQEYEDSFKSTKTNKTGIAWVNRTGSKWTYSRQVDGKAVSISADTVEELHKKVISNNLLWGIRDYDKASNIIDIPPNFNIPKRPEKANIKINNIDYSGIYRPLPQEYEDSFKSTKTNKTGIAWVNKIGKRWVYSRSVNGKQIDLFDYDIYGLYSQVIKNNLIWGIRDYDLAKQFIDIPNDYEIKEQKISDKKDNLVKNIDPGIYAPLPKKYLETFPKQSNQTGIAWVNKIGNQFIYSRNINGNSIQIKDYDLSKLYNKVIKQNQIWGIRNYNNARKFIDIPDDFEIPEIYKESKSINTDIYAPLSQEHISKFNPNMNNKTGIAWVSQIGNKWFYQRQKKGQQIRFSDEDIHKLHEKVIKNNQIWGITDLEKAKKIIDPSQKNINEEITPKVNVSQNVSVINISKNENNEYVYIIKGLIKYNELFTILNNLKQFEVDIKRIITNSTNNQIDLFIELHLSSKSIRLFKEKIEEIGWEIN